MSFAKTILCIQARLDSNRLAGKTLLPIIGNKTLLDCVMQNLYGVADDYFVLCPEDCVEAFQKTVSTSQYRLISGSKNNVLERFAKAIDSIECDYIIRATADNCLIGSSLPIELLRLAKENNADYARFLGTPYGGGVEIVKKSALLLAYKEATSDFDKEHVCPYIYNNPNKFKLLLVQAPDKWQGEQLRATIDTEADYQYVKKVYDSLYQDRAIELEEFINWGKSS